MSVRVRRRQVAAAGSLRGLALGVRALGGRAALTGILGDRVRGGCARLGLGWVMVRRVGA
jgi:hypothetical protein